MVTKETIHTIILKAIETTNKCHIHRIGTFSLNNNIKSRLNKFREKTKEYENETMEWINNKGEVVFSKDSTDPIKKNIRYTEEELNNICLNGEYNLIIDHNHPGAYAKAIGEENVFANDPIPTLLSEGDVRQLWVKSMTYIDETNETKNVTPFKGIVAECPNGSRMSLIRKAEDDIVLNDRKLGLLDSTRENKFMGAYRRLHDKWLNFLYSYRKQHESHMKEWGDEMGDDWTVEKYTKERDKFGIKYSKENFNEEYLKESIQEFEDLGFELSVEWR